MILQRHIRFYDFEDTTLVTKLPPLCLTIDELDFVMTGIGNDVARANDRNKDRRARKLNNQCFSEIIGAPQPRIPPNFWSGTEQLRKSYLEPLVQQIYPAPGFFRKELIIDLCVADKEVVLIRRGTHANLPAGSD